MIAALSDLHAIRKRRVPLTPHPPHSKTWRTCYAHFSQQRPGSTSLPRRQYLIDYRLVQGNEARQAIFDGELHFTLNQRTGVFDELLIRQETIFADPITRDEVFDVGDFCQRLEAGAPFHVAI